MTHERQNLENQTRKAGPGEFDSLAFQSAAKEIIRSKEVISEEWEARVREHIVEAAGKTTLVMRNSLGIFIDELSESLLDYKTSKIKQWPLFGMSKMHGGQRAHITGYFLPQLLEEFCILRQVINERLSKCGYFDYQILTHVNKFIDSAVSQAATEFAKVQQESVNFALRKAEVSNRDLEHFAAVAAHDLKSPLATISGYLDLLSDEFKDEIGKETLQYIQLMQSASTRMRNLIERLLDFARLSTADRPLKPTDVNCVVNAVRQNLAKVLEQSKGRILSKSLPTVMGDSDLLVQLFQNLISNSLKFRGANPPEVHIEAKERQDTYVFEVKDNGIGFDPKYKEEIFALYKKLHGESEYQGTGIGLATVRKVVELHGGKIWAESKPGLGSTFYFTFPKIMTENQGHH
jgi:signal transduction histidine kinase